MVISSRKHKIPTRVYSRFAFVLSVNVFCKGNGCSILTSVCVLLSGVLHVYQSDVIVAGFEIVYLQNTGLNRLKIVELFGPVF